jgi:hypothetical protein
MVRKGCTAAYDMFAEFPLPSAEGVEAVARAYSDAGMRATIAPMMADRSFYEAIPGLAEALPPELREQALKAKYAPYKETLSSVARLLHGWKYDHDSIRPALGRRSRTTAATSFSSPAVTSPPSAAWRADARRRVEAAGGGGAEDLRQESGCALARSRAAEREDSASRTASGSARTIASVSPMRARRSRTIPEAT